MAKVICQEGSPDLLFTKWGRGEPRFSKGMLVNIPATYVA